MKVNTNALSGIALDFAVAKCECSGLGSFEGDMLKLRITQGVRPAPYSTNRDQGGEIIERERICIEHRGDSGGWRARIWNDEMCDFIEVGRTGPYCNTFLIAAMRCYVLAKMGEVVDVPDELMEV